MMTPREKFLPYCLPLIGEEEIAEVTDSLRSGWVTTGPKVKQFEGDVQKYVNCSHAIAVNSCTAGLHITLTAMGVGPGDEVILPSLTFCATANVVVHRGAKPVLVDVQDDFNISPEAIEAAITPRTKVIIPVHYGGMACDLKEIYEIASRHNIAVLEDGAHAIGITYNGYKIGSDDLVLQEWHKGVQSAVVYSFYATKNMTTGEGGLIATAHEDLANHMRILSLHGMSRDAWKRYSSAGSWYYEVIDSGYKYNMTDIQAALGIHQLRRLDGFIETRQQYAAMYDAAFAEMPEIITPVKHADRSHAYHLYVIRLNQEMLTIDRAQFIEKLKEFNVGTSVHYIPVHLHPFYQKQFGYKRGDLSKTEEIYDSIVSLPLYPLMRPEDAEYVIEVVKNVIQNHRR